MKPTKPTKTKTLTKTAVTRTGKWKSLFIRQLLATANVGTAARRAGVNRDTVYQNRKIDEKFAKAWDEALELAVDAMEQECQRRAFEGYEKPVWHNGKQVGTEREFSDTLAIFMLKAHRPNRFRERFGFADETPTTDPRHVLEAMRTLMGLPAVVDVQALPEGSNARPTKP